MTTEPKPAGDEKEDVDRLDEARDWTDPRGAGVAAIEGPMLDKAVVLAAQSMDLDEADLALGVELARLLPASIDRVRVAVLVTAARLPHARGSTRPPLRGSALRLSRTRI